jgi:hypothetical protein
MAVLAPIPSASVAGQRERWRFAQHTPRVLQIAHNAFDEAAAAHVAALLLNPRDATQPPQRRRSHRGRSHPEPDVLFDFLIEMELQFAVELSLDGATPQQRPQPQAHNIEPPFRMHCFTPPPCG